MPQLLTELCVCLGGVLLQIRVNQEDRQLTISGERRRPAAAKSSDPAAEGSATSSSEPVGRRRRTERRFGRFERKFGKAQLPDDADLDAVSAKCALAAETIVCRGVLCHPSA